MAATSTSPTLTLKVRAPEALNAFKELKANIDAVKASLAGLNAGLTKGTQSGTARLQAEVKELRAALQATRLETEALTKANETLKQRGVKAVAEKVTAHKAGNAEMTRSDEERTVKAKSLLAAQVRAEATAAKERQGIVRSAERGVAGASGMLWLAYGQSLPALGGAFAATTAVKESIQQGADFQKQMTFVRIASDESAESVDRLSKQVLDLGGKSIFGPVELAKGLRLLTQAGLTTTEAMAALRPVMNLAVIGEMDMGKAAETASGMMHAFGLSVQDIPHIGDALAKAANLSQTNVSEMSQAMRQASTVAQQFNVNVDEMSGLLAILAQRNIRGSAAGTALRNMLNELDPASVKARRAFKKLNIEVTDTNRRFKPIVPLMQEFAQKFAQFNQVSQVRIANDYFNNRGAKAFLNAIAEANASLPRFVAEIAKSSEGVGYLERSVALLGKTADGEFKKMKGALEASLIKGFQGSSDEIVKLIRSFNAAISDPAFISGITTLVSASAKITSFVVDHAASLAGFVGSWALFGKVLPSVATGIVAVRTAVMELMASGLFVGGGVAAAGGLLSRGLVAARGGAIGMVLWGTYEVVEFLGILDTVRGKLTDIFERLAALNAVKPASVEGIGTRVVKGKLDELKSAPWWNQVAGAWEGAVAESAKQNSAQQAQGKRTYERLDQEIEALKNANIAAADARFRREVQATEQISRFKQQSLEAQHRFGLISEAEYVRGIDELNRQRVADAVRASDAAIANITRERDALKKGADKVRAQIRLDDEAAKRDALIREAEQQQQIIRYKIEGQEKAARDSTQKELQKHREDEQLRREGARLEIENRLRPEAVAAAYAAELDTRKRFQESINRVDDEIRKHKQDEAAVQRELNRLFEEGRYSELEVAKKEAEFNGQVLTTLREKKRLIEDLRDVEAKRNAENARANKEYERSADYGFRRFFKEYQDAATNAAEQSREVWSKALGGMEETLLKFIQTGKFEWKKFANDIFVYLTQIQIKRALAGLKDKFFPGNAGGALVEGLLGGNLGLIQGFVTGSGGTVATTAGANLANSALNTAYALAGWSKGDVFDRGEVVPFGTGGLVTEPVMFSMSRGRTGMMGEKSIEAIMPLARTPSGELGVRSQGEGGTTVYMTVTTPDVNSFNASRSQIIADLAGEIQRSRRNR